MVVHYTVMCHANLFRVLLQARVLQVCFRCLTGEPASISAILLYPFLRTAQRTQFTTARSHAKDKISIEISVWLLIVS